MDSLHDALRSLGDLTVGEAQLRCESPGSVPAWLEELEASNRAIRLRVAGEERWIAIEDSSRFRDALGAALPVGVPGAFLEPVADPLGDLVARLEWVEPGRTATWEGRGPAHSYARTAYRLSDRNGGGTHFEYENEFKPPGGFLGKAASRVLVGGQPQKEATQSLRQLKGLLEA